jgi:transcription elongation factor GreA
VKFGAYVSLEDVDSGEEKHFRIVGPEEADVAKGSISVTSPMSRACINQEVGDEIRVVAPGGTRKYQIIDLKWNK